MCTFLCTFLFWKVHCGIWNRYRKVHISVHSSVLNCALWDMEQMECGICEIGPLGTMSHVLSFWHFCSYGSMIVKQSILRHTVACWPAGPCRPMAPVDPVAPVIPWAEKNMNEHYNDVIMSAMTSQATSFAIVYSTVYLGTCAYMPHSASMS